MIFGRDELLLVQKSVGMSSRFCPAHHGLANEATLQGYLSASRLLPFAPIHGSACHFPPVTACSLRPRYRSATIEGCSTRRPAAKSNASRINCACAQARGVADVVAVPDANPG